MKKIIFSGSSNLPLAQKVALNLKSPLGKLVIKRFSDGEFYVNLLTPVRGKEVCILQSGSNPVNDHLMEVLMIADAAKRGGAKKITALLPFYPYRRQERQTEKGEAVSAHLVAKLLEAAGVKRVVVFDIHHPIVKKFFNVPFFNLKAFALFVAYLEKKKLKDAVVVAPDKGGQTRSFALAQALKIPLVYCQKDRQKMHDKIARLTLRGDVKGKEIIIIEDEISTGGTLAELSKLLKKEKIKNIYVVATHAVLSGKARERLSKAPIKELILTDTILVPPVKRLKKMKFVSVSGLLAEFIDR